MEMLSKKSWVEHPLFQKCIHCVKLITVEPTMILYMLAFMTTSIVEQAFFIDKACRVNHGYNTTICDNITLDTYTEINKQVHITVSTFHLWNDIVGHLPPIFIALFMGAWSDKRGRKLLMIIGLAGKLYYSIMIIINASQPTWPLEYVILTATLPMAFTGADLAIFSSAFTYVIDVSSEKNRTMRLTLLEVCYLATIPTGIALGSYLFSSVFNRSFIGLFAVNVSLTTLAIIYSMLRLNMCSNSHQEPLSKITHIFNDFFDYNHMIETYNTIAKERRNNKKLFLILLIIMMALYTFQRDEKPIVYLYVQLVMNWSFEQYSMFKIVQSSIQDVVLLLFPPLLIKFIGWRDTIIIMIGALAHFIGRIFYVTSYNSTLFYIGGIFTAIGPIVAPVIRSMVSKIIDKSEKGKIFSILAVADNAIPLISGVCYSKIYNVTIHTHPSAIFYMTMGTQIGVLILILLIHYRTNDIDFTSDDNNPLRYKVISKKRIVF